MTDPRERLSPEGHAAAARYELEKTLVAMDALDRALESIPEERLGEQPVEEQLAIGPMIAHALGAVAMTSRAFCLGKCDEEDVADLMDDEHANSREAIRAMSTSAHKDTVAALQATDSDSASRMIDFWFGWSLSGLDTVNIGYGELLHHRGQVQSFMRLMGLEPPDIYSQGEEEVAEPALDASQ